MPALWTNLEAAAASAEMHEKAVWTLEASRDLNVNLVRFGVGWSVEEYTNDDVWTHSLWVCLVQDSSNLTVKSTP